MPPVYVTLHAAVPFKRTQYVVAALGLTEYVAPAVVASELLPTVAPVPHSYTAPEPRLPPLAVNVAEVDIPLHIVGTLEDKPVGAVGGVSTVANTAVRGAADTQPVAEIRAWA